MTKGVISLLLLSCVVLISCRDHGSSTAVVDSRILALREKAEGGDAQSQTDLGNCYAKGMGVLKDLSEAYKWYSLSAAQSEKLAEKNQIMLEIAMTPGEIAEVVKKKERQLMERAQEGTAAAQTDLALFYAYRLGATRDDEGSVKWFRKAAEQGDATAQVGLGVCFFEGDGVPKDREKAVKWYLKAVEQGNAQAHYLLGKCYESGEGVTQNTEVALNCFRKAAEQGNSGGQMRLGHAYILGTGVPKDWIEAYKWLKLSAAKSDENTKQWLAFIEQKMTGEQIDEAQKRAKEWKPVPPR